MANPDPHHAAWYIDILGHFKEHLIPISLGLGIMLAAILRWIGAQAINDFLKMKRAQSTYATKKELEDCHTSITRRIDFHFDRVHERIDELMLKKENK